MLIKAEWPTLGIGAQRKNFIINGNMDIWQRGITGFSATGALPYAADRFLVYAAGSAVPVARMTGDARSHFCLGFTGSTGNTECAMLHRIESVNAWSLNQKDIVISGAFFSQAVGQTVTALLYKPNAPDSYGSKVLLASKLMGTITQNSFTTLSASFPAATFPETSFSDGLEVVFSFGAIANGIIAAATRIQLEVGLIATPFEFVHFSDTLQMCQRYFEKSYNLDTFAGGSGAGAGAGSFAVTTAVGCTLQAVYKTRKRLATTDVRWFSPLDGAEGFCRNYDTGVNAAVTLGSYGSAMAGGLVAGQASLNLLAAHWIANAEI